MEKKADKFLLQLYLRDQCNKEQLTIVRHYLTDAGYKESLEEFLQSDWKETNEEKIPSDDNLAEKYERFLVLVNKEKVLPVVQKRRSGRLFLRKMGWAAAAVVTGISLALFVWWMNDRRQEMQDQQWVHLHNEAGRRTVFFLPDSTRVYLGAASSFEYNKGYGITNRNTRLQGEAYFIVKHEGAHPFNVTTGRITTVDIGTEFNIRYLKNLPAIEVAVAKGTVEVLNNREGNTQRIATLGQRQQLLFDTASCAAEINTLYGEEAIGTWREGVLAFRKQAFHEVAAELERYYGLTIHFEDEINAGILITTTLRDATVNEALEIIGLTAGVKIKRVGDDVWIQ